jgi:hypothetical protein
MHHKKEITDSPPTPWLFFFSLCSCSCSYIVAFQLTSSHFFYSSSFTLYINISFMSSLLFLFRPFLRHTHTLTRMFLIFLLWFRLLYFIYYVDYIRYKCMLCVSFFNLSHEMKKERRIKISS